MKIENKLIELYRKGLEVFVDGDGLKYKSTFGVPEKEDISFLRMNKKAIMDILNKNDGVLIHSLNIDELPLTEIQSAYLLGRRTHFELGGVASHVYMEVMLPLLDVVRAEKIWNDIIMKHDALHSIFTSNNTQKILKEYGYYKIECNEGVDVKEKITLTRDKFKGKSYKADIWPLFDISISQLYDNSLLHLSFDFLILDWTSIWILLKEFEECYFDGKMIMDNSYDLKEIRMGQLKLKQSSKYLSDKDFWEKRIPLLPDAPLLPIETEIVKNSFERTQLRIDNNTWYTIKTNLSEIGVTQTSFLVTILALVLNRWSSNPEFTLNLTTMNRPKDYLDRDIVNDFTSTELLAFRIKSTQPFCDLLKNIQQQMIEDLQHETFTGVEVTRAVRKNIERRDTVFPFVFTSALGIKSSEYKYITLQKEGLSETPQVLMDCQVMEVNYELIVNFDLRRGAFSKELSDSIVEDYFNLLNSFSDSGYFKKLITEIYDKNKMNKQIFKMNDVAEDESSFDRVKDEVIKYSRELYNKNIFDVGEVRNILEERNLFSNQVMLKTLMEIKGNKIHKDFENISGNVIIDEYYWILSNWEKHLEKSGFIEDNRNFYTVSKKGNELLERSFDMKSLKNSWDSHIGDSDVIDYIIKTSENIINIFYGKIKPISILFPEGSSKIVESIYGNNIFCNYYNNVIRKAIEEIIALDSHKDISILELGAGTGNTTKEILKMLETKRLNYRYIFTDRALSFLSNARNKFDNYKNVEYKQVDIDNNLLDQNFFNDEINIILAVGVLENAKELKNTISSMEKVLKKNSWVIILEPVVDEPWILMTQLFFMPEVYRNEIYYDSYKWKKFLIGENENISTKVFSIVSEEDPYNINNIKIFICKKESKAKNKHEIPDKENVNEYELSTKNDTYNSSENNVHNMNIEKISDIVEKMLGKKNISLDMDLYNCGADSLLLAQLSREIVDIFNKSKNIRKLKFDEVYRKMLKKPTIKTIVNIVEYEALNSKIDESRSENINDYKLNLFNEGHDLLRVVLFDSLGTDNNIKNVLDELIEKNDSTIATFSIINENSYCNTEDKNLLSYISNLYAEFIEKLNYNKIQLIGFQTGGVLAIEIATKLLKKGKIIDKTVLINSCPIQGLYLSDRVIEEEFLKVLGVNENTLFEYLDNDMTAYINLQTNRNKRLKLYSEIVQKEISKEISYEYILKSFSIHKKTLNGFKTSVSPYIGNVEIILNEEYMYNYGISNENVLDQWRNICFGVLTSHEVKKESIKKFLLKSVMTKENNNE